MRKGCGECFAKKFDVFFFENYKHHDTINKLVSVRNHNLVINVIFVQLSQHNKKKKQSKNSTSLKYKICSNFITANMSKTL